MHLIRLFDYLTAKCGPPVMAKGEDLYWECERGFAISSIRICVSTHEQERKAAIWIFDPAVKESVVHLRVENQQDLDQSMSLLESRLTNRA